MSNLIAVALFLAGCGTSAVVGASVERWSILRRLERLRLARRGAEQLAVQELARVLRGRSS